MTKLPHGPWCADRTAGIFKMNGDPASDGNSVKYGQDRPGPMPGPRWKNGKIAHGPLPEGCVQCEKGAKMVLLATGLCSCACWYCPLSARKKGHDVVFADELEVSPDDVEAILREARMIDALGTGVTGGDPADVLDRVVGYIEALKGAFGHGHHVHMYTGTPLGRPSIDRLAAAGLDEVRFHPAPQAWRSLPAPFASALEGSLDAGMAAGVEIPALPGTKDDILALADALEGLDASFLNLNELEYSETNYDAIRDRRMTWRSDTSNAIRGSERVGLQAVTWAHDNGTTLTVHYCSSAYKDGVQLRNRLKRRAKNVARAYDVMTDDGTILKGIVEAGPGADPIALAASIAERFDIPDGMIGVRYGRVEVASWVLEGIAAELREKAFIVEEYPTEDRLEVERTPLN